MPPALSLAERLRAKVVVDLAGCWIWQGARDPSGYGAIRVGPQKKNAHRLAYEVFVGSVPRTRVVCHRCHNPACINPEHLYAGTRAQNLADAYRAGKSGRARLTPAQVAAIRRSRKPREWIVKRYGIAFSTVSKIKLGLIHRQAA